MGKTPSPEGRREQVHSNSDTKNCLTPKSPKIRKSTSKYKKHSKKGSIGLKKPKIPQKTKFVLNKSSVCEMAAVDQISVEEMTSDAKVTSVEETAVEEMTFDAQKTSVEEMTYDTKKTSMEERTSVAKDTSVEERSSVAKDTSVEERSSVAKDTSVEERSPVAKDTSVEERSSVAKDTSVEERSSVVKDTSVEERSSVAKDTSVEERSSVVKDTSVEERSSVVKDTSVEERSSVAKDTSVEKRFSAVKETLVEKRTYVSKETSLEKKTLCVEPSLPENGIMAVVQMPFVIAVSTGQTTVDTHMENREQQWDLLDSTNSEPVDNCQIRHSFKIVTGNSCSKDYKKSNTVDKFDIVIPAHKQDMRVEVQPSDDIPTDNESEPGSLVIDDSRAVDHMYSWRDKEVQEKLAEVHCGERTSLVAGSASPSKATHTALECSGNGTPHAENNGENDLKRGLLLEGEDDTREAHCKDKEPEEDMASIPESTSSTVRSEDWGSLAQQAAEPGKFQFELKPEHSEKGEYVNINDLVQDYSNSSMLAMESPQSCLKPSLWVIHLMLQHAGICIFFTPN